MFNVHHILGIKQFMFFFVIYYFYLPDQLFKYANVGVEENV